MQTERKILLTLTVFKQCAATFASVSRTMETSRMSESHNHIHVMNKLQISSRMDWEGIRKLTVYSCNGVQHFKQLCLGTESAAHSDKACVLGRTGQEESVGPTSQVVLQSCTELLGSDLCSVRNVGHARQEGCRALAGSVMSSSESVPLVLVKQSSHIVSLCILESCQHRLEGTFYAYIMQ